MENWGEGRKMGMGMGMWGIENGKSKLNYLTRTKLPLLHNLVIGIGLPGISLIDSLTV